MVGAEGAVGTPPPDGLFLLELVEQDVRDGRDDGGLVLPLPQLPQELEVHVDEGVELGEEALEELRLHVEVLGEALAEDPLDHLQQLAVVLLGDDELVDVLLEIRRVRREAGAGLLELIKPWIRPGAFILMSLGLLLKLDFCYINLKIS